MKWNSSQAGPAPRKAPKASRIPMRWRRIIRF